LGEEPIWKSARPLNSKGLLPAANNQGFGGFGAPKIEKIERESQSSEYQRDKWEDEENDPLGLLVNEMRINGE
jgi:hypothetical protein